MNSAEQQEIESLRRQVRALADANVRAAELMADLEEAAAVQQALKRRGEELQLQHDVDQVVSSHSNEVALCRGLLASLIDSPGLALRPYGFVGLLIDGECTEVARVSDNHSAEAGVQKGRTCRGEPAHVDPQGFVYIPIIGHSAAVGCILVRARPGLSWSERWLPLLQTIGGQVGAHVDLLRTKAESTRAHQAVKSLAMAVEQVSESIVVVDAGGAATYVNLAAQQSVGWPADETGRVFFDTLPQPESSGLPFHLTTVIDSGETWRGAPIVHTTAGACVDTKMSITALRDRLGDIVGAVIVFRDTTRELALERQQRQAQKMESLGRLAGGVAHDFNNWLQVIFTSVEMIASEVPVSLDIKGDLEAIEEAAKQAKSLTSVLLSFSRDQPTAVGDVQLNATVATSVGMLQRIVGSTYTLTSTFAPELPDILAAGQQVSQILINLVLNARDAMERGGTIKLRTCSVVLTEDRAEELNIPQGDYACLEVLDEGVGMPPDVLDQMFDPFFTTKDLGRGTGLGLSTCFNLISRTGGAIKATSTESVGTSVRVYFPLSDRDQATKRT